MNIAWLGFVGGLLGCTQEAPVSEQPMVVLVSIDTLRADHLSSYGYERKTSPFLDTLAESGTRFEYARSASPWTLPAHATMLTGQLPATHHIVDDSVSLSSSTPILAEELQKKGWGTGGVVSTMYVSSLFGFDRGFDFFEDFDLLSEKKNLSGTVDAENIIDTALSWFGKQSADKPLFLFLHFYDVHYAYEAPAPFDTVFDRAPQKGDLKYKNYFHFKKKKVKAAQKDHQIAQYDEEILYVDAQLKRLSDVISAKRSDLRWVITADHGEEFWERGSWGHAHTLYSEQLHIPLIVSGQDVPTSVVDSGWVGNHDVAPTIAAWGEVELQADGIDLSAYFSGEQTLPERPMLAETTRFKTNRISLFEGGYRLEWDLNTGKSELFHTQEDLKETTDLSNTEPEIAFAFKKRTEELLGKPWTAQDSGTVVLSKAIAFKDGRHSRTLNVEKGDSFQILPYDASILFQDTEGAKQGPWYLVGGDSSNDTALTIEKQQANRVELDDAAKKKLEQLGYIQND